MPSQTSSPESTLSVILKAGITAGFLDALGALINNLNVNPLQIFRYIASGLLGNSAFSGGVLTAIVGIILHFLIAATWAFIFFLAYPKIIRLFKSKVLTGVLYGIVIWLIMNLIVVPVSRTPPTSPTFSKAIVGIAIIIICVGLPISFIISKYYRKKYGN